MNDKKNIIHFLYVPFTGLGLYKGFRGDTWLKNRIQVFKRFVIPALMNQTKREFIVWISWRSEERGNPIVKELMQHLDKLDGMRFVHTFGGCCFYDDKYPDPTARKRLFNALNESLPVLREWVPTDTDAVYVTIQPSDDMFLTSAVEDIQAQPYKPHGAFGWRAGYMIRYDTLEVSEYDPKTIPPFFTIMFPRSIFLDPKSHFDYIGPYASHEYVKDVLAFKDLPGRGFVVGTHGENISTRYDHSFRGKVLDEEERQRVLVKAGLLFAEPLIVIKDRKRRLMKRIINMLPRTLQYHIVRMQSPGVTTKIKEYRWHNV